jgi:hypothetical protein
LGLLLIPIIKPFFCVAYDDTFVLSDRLLCNAYRVRACSSIRVFEISFFLLCVLSPHSCLLNVVLTHSSLSAITPNLYIYNILPFVCYFFLPIHTSLGSACAFYILIVDPCPMCHPTYPLPFLPSGSICTTKKIKAKRVFHLCYFFRLRCPQTKLR